MNKIENFLDREASAAADIDEMDERLSEQAAVRIDEILIDPEQRDPEIFELLGAPVDDSFPDYFDVPDLERDVIWAASLSALTVAARMQAWIELYARQTLEQAERNGRELDSLRKQMSGSELKTAALKGIGKARINGEKLRRRSESDN